MNKFENEPATFISGSSVLYVKNVNIVKDIFINTFNFREDKAPSDLTGGVVVERYDGCNRVTLAEIPDDDKQPSRIVIDTEDCLRDFYLLRKKNIHFTKELSYTAAGLTVEFVDEAGNIYMLLEERSYSNQQSR